MRVIRMLGLALTLSGTVLTNLAAQALGDWPIHSPDRPAPPVVDPGPAGQPVAPPADAIILFDGRDLSRWASGDSLPARWKVENGYFEVAARTGALRTKQSFGSMHLHIEWATPERVVGDGQERGNSGVYLMNTYEVQVLDSYQNRTYADGQAASIYGQYPPIVNASRAPGQWQTYDIVFRAPRFAADGAVLEPARVTVIHNGFVVQNNVALTGPTGHYARPPYAAHPDKLPISLQDHGNPVRYRNVWVRELPDPR